MSNANVKTGDDQRIYDLANSLLDDEGFRDGAQATALRLHHIGENTKPSERPLMCDAIRDDLIRRATAEAISAGLPLTPAQIQDFASALMLASFDLLYRLPKTGALQ